MFTFPASGSGISDAFRERSEASRLSLVIKVTPVISVADTSPEPSSGKNSDPFTVINI